MRLLVIEDGQEYSNLFSRFLPHIERVRAGSGGEALALLTQRSFDAVYLDMRFDRIPEASLLGDFEATIDQFGGDPRQALAHLQDHQGVYVLHALRSAGFTQPVMLSYDFSAEQARWERLRARYGPVEQVRDLDGPTQIEERIHAMIANAAR
jgi:hypothetical protein